MLPCDKAKFKAGLSFRSFVSKIFALCMDLSMCCFCVILEPTFGVLMGEIIYNNDIFDHCKNSGSPGAVLSVVIISPFSIPPSPQTHTLTQTHTHKNSKHKSFPACFIPCARAGLQKQFQLKNKVLFFNFRAICAGVSLVYLASTLVFTYLFKGKGKDGQYDLWTAAEAQFSMLCT